MPRARRKNAQFEELQQAKQQVVQLQRQLHQHNGYHHAPLPRPFTMEWDWNCAACGRLVYAPKSRCNCSLPNNTRGRGATAVGSIRGQMQNTTAARHATTAQARIPQSFAPSYHVRRNVNSSMGGGGNAAANSQTATVPVATRGAAVPVRNNTVPQACANPAAAEVPVSAAERTAQDESAALQAEPAEEDEGTIPEDLPPHKIELTLLKLESKLNKKRQLLAKEEQAIAFQEEEIAVQRAKLVQLQAEADGTRELIQGFLEDRDELTQRLAKLTKLHHDDLPSAGIDGQPEVQSAMDCLSRTFLGLQNYQSQPPEIQAMLTQFAQLFRATQAEHEAKAGPGQLTIHQAFASQASAGTVQAPLPQGPASVAAQSFVISSGSTTPLDPATFPARETSKNSGLPLSSLSAEKPTPAAERPEPAADDKGIVSEPTVPTDMAVVGHSVGDKRKIEHVQDMERLAKNDQDSPAISTTEQDSSIQTAGAELEGPTMARKDLYRHLGDEVARTAARSRRPTPYAGEFHV